MGLLSDIYNTVAKFFRQQDEPVAGDASKSVATNRLKLVLMQDRTNLTPKILEQMRGELVDLLSKYLEMDKELLELNFEQDGEQVALMLSIPVIRAKDEAEIEQALAEAEVESESEDNEDCVEEISDVDSEVQSDDTNIEEEDNQDVENIEEADNELDMEENSVVELSIDEEKSETAKKQSKKNSASNESQEETLETI